MPPKSRRHSPEDLRDPSEATPRARLKRSALPRDSLASTASTRSRTASGAISAASSSSKPPSAPRRIAESVRSRNDSLLPSGSSVGRTYPTVEVSVPRTTSNRGPSGLSTSQSTSKLRKRTDEEPYNATPKARSRTQSNSTLARSVPSASNSVRPSLASVHESMDKYADSEPIKAFLRLRPPSEDSSKEQNKPYIQVVSETEVFMHPPKETDYTNARTAARARVHSAAASTKYVFSKVFDPEASAVRGGTKQASSQAEFFRDTTLPMVEELLQGQSGLIFTYGVTNSGKSFTVTGGDGPGEAGILPRALDVVFNSIKGLESKTNIRPAGASGIERGVGSDGLDLNPSAGGINLFSLPGLTRKLLNDALSRSLKAPRAHHYDTTKVAVDRNLRYSVWVSYVEIYNEKLFDLLDTPSTPGTGGLTRSESTRGSSWSIAAMAANGSDTSNITLNRKPLSLKSDSEGCGKYVAGLKEIKVNSAAEARDLLIRGQENRAVFGTMANRASSRSHGVFTIKLVREHGGISNLQDMANGDLSSSYSVARLSIVDLAGSERLVNTGLTSGDRLKEAGNINKSLMCLGQCLETLRKNQSRALAMSELAEGPPPSLPGRPRPSKLEYPSSIGHAFKKRPSIVPFRHSKLTELFQGFFTGEGKAVMIVNANPYDTGFDENSHVMKFSAVAKEVGTVRAQPNTLKTLPIAKPAVAEGARRPGRPRKTPRESESARSVSVRSEGHDITIVEDDESDEEDTSDPFVDLLVERHEELRQSLYAAEMRCATIENEIRQEMANEMEQRLLEMQSLYNQKMASDAEQHEQFVNRKIDLLVRTNMAHEGTQQRSAKSSSDESELSEMSDAEMGSDAKSESTSESEDEEDGEEDEENGQEQDQDQDQDQEADEADAAMVDESLALAAAQQPESDGAGSADSIELVSFVSSTSRQSTRGGRSSGEAPKAVAAPFVEVVVPLSQTRASQSPAKQLSSSDSEEASANDDRMDQDGSDDSLTSDEDQGSGGDTDGERNPDHDEQPGDGDDLDADGNEGPRKRIATGRSRQEEAQDSDSSFDLAPEDSSDDEFRPTNSRASKSSRQSTSAKGKRRGSVASRTSSRKSTRTALWDQTNDISHIALSDMSDASMIAEECVTPKPKRKLRKKAAVQEDDVVDQIGDPSLLEAVQQSASKTPRRRSRMSLR